ncbi:MBL fold metallo-hydrolase [Candidatus Aerophobetes bacterium]|nr:MBL fold metallo-hydrolase [Candidatus Aerophobetes bacterium]
MIVQKIIVGNLQANCYIIAEKKEGKGLIVDPGGDVNIILDFVEENKLQILYVIATHAHIDHIANVKEVKEATGAKFLLHPLDVSFLSDPNLNLSLFMESFCTFPAPERLLQDGEKLTAGQIELQVIHTPGHTPGSISLKINNFVFTGDTLFAGGVGRVDLPGGDFETLQRSIREKIFSLPDNTKVFPGHGPETFVEKEKKDNPFV